MLHPVQPSAHPLPVYCERLSKGRSDITNAAGIPYPIPHQPQTGLIPQGEEGLTPQVRAWMKIRWNEARQGLPGSETTTLKVLRRTWSTT